MSGLVNGDRFDQPSAPRPGLYPQHSNSVPSTPYQKPRNFSRSSSKSPSPHRNLSNQSPRSVVSEAVGFSSVAHRGAPVVCKFETGDEIRKRRMPYVDGGDQELGAPKKEPRKTLDPNEKDKLSGDMRELYDRLLPSPESEERRAKLVEKLDRILNEEWPGNDIRVNVFGSSGNLLSSTDSDVDICITAQSVKSLERIHPLAALLDKHGMQRVVCRAAAKVPIVKCWDPELSLATDLNINNTLALQNTRLIKTYVQLDDRVRPLAKIIKYWTKQRILNDAAFGATISSYTWICMVISFLQRRKPPILPSLQKIQDGRTKTNPGEQSPFADDVESLKGFGEANKETLGDLLFHFFRHYGYEFEYSRHVVSVREGRLVSRKEKGWDPANALSDKQANNRLCVEEPFTSARNLGNTADDYAWHGIHLEIRRAFELLDNGLQLSKCCEQYEFPKEEKPIFQRPPPKPKPTLTRSASQSGQSNREPGSGGRSRKNNRNQSAQRAGNRRASSGASFSNQRMPFSPPLGMNSSDYFQLKGSLHEQLYQQYQYLQAQQDVLRSQLAQQQAQAQSRVGDLAGASPRPRPYVDGLITNGLPNPRVGDMAPQTAPLPNGYLYHYPARFPLTSPMSQARPREGTNTNPSSPSRVAAVPALRRQVHRASIPGQGSAGSVRSQSQPGRSLPHPLALQQQILPGYDMSGTLSGQYASMRSSSQAFHSGPAGMQVPFPPHVSMQSSTASLENAMPKEYVGYYVGQSPQLGPQQYAAQPQNHIVLPAMTLRDPPLRQRRMTPELMPPIANGRHSSRSPSPLSDMRSSSTTAQVHATQPWMVQSPTMFEHIAPVTQANLDRLSANVDNGGPLIVNGSNRGPFSRPVERVNGTSAKGLQIQTDLSLQPSILHLADASLAQSGLTEPEGFKSGGMRQTELPNGKSPALLLSPMSRSGSDRHFTPVSASGTEQIINGVKDVYHESTPLTAGPLLSPVAELPTPSPTRPRFDTNGTYDTNGGPIKSGKVATTKQALTEIVENVTAPRADSKHERRGSAPVTTLSSLPQALKPSPPQMPTQPNQNTWQQVPKKGHKKNKSTSGLKSVNGSSGQSMPMVEAERKGG